MSFAFLDDHGITKGPPLAHRIGFFGRREWMQEDPRLERFRLAHSERGLFWSWDRTGKDNTTIPPIIYYYLWFLFANLCFWWIYNICMFTYILFYVCLLGSSLSGGFSVATRKALRSPSVHTWHMSKPVIRFFHTAKDSCSQSGKSRAQTY